MATRRDETVLVFGATGQQGGSTARALVADGWRVRALVRDPAKEAAKELEALGVELVRGDMRDRDSLARAVNGAYGVFSMQPSSGQPDQGVTDEDERSFGVTIADLSRAAGVRHFVYSSVAGLTGDTGVGHFHSKWLIEEHVRASGLPATIVRPGTFMELLLAPPFGLGERRFVFFTRPDQRIPAIAVEDIGKLVARVFADRERHVGRTIDLAGEELTGVQIADAVGRALGEKFSYAQFSAGDFPESSMFARLLALFERSGIRIGTDVSGLGREVPGLLTFDAWLAKTGAAAIRALRSASAT